jgi:hypothetical protein
MHTNIIKKVVIGLGIFLTIICLAIVGVSFHSFLRQKAINIRNAEEKIDSSLKIQNDIVKSCIKFSKMIKDENYLLFGNTLLDDHQKSAKMLADASHLYDGSIEQSSRLTMVVIIVLSIQSLFLIALLYIFRK